MTNLKPSAHQFSKPKKLIKNSEHYFRVQILGDKIYDIYLQYLLLYWLTYEIKGDKPFITKADIEDRPSIAYSMLHAYYSSNVYLRPTRGTNAFDFLRETLDGDAFKLPDFEEREDLDYEYDEEEGVVTIYE